MNIVVAVIACYLRVCVAVQTTHTGSLFASPTVYVCVLESIEAVAFFTTSSESYCLQSLSFPCQIVGLTGINLDIYKLTLELVNVTIQVYNIPMPRPTHHLRRHLDVAFLHQNFDSPSQHASTTLGGVLFVEYIDASQSILFDGIVHLVGPQCSWCVGPR